MKVVVRIATTCIWLLIMVVMSSSAVQQVGAYDTVTFNLEKGIGDYPPFLTNLRGQFGGTRKACGLPVTQNTLPKGKEYVLADLKISSTNSVTVALKVTDLYLVAYRVNNKEYDGKYRAVFLNEPDIKDAKAKLFKDASTTQIDLKYDSNYASIEKVAGGSRKNIPLGYQELRKKLKAFFDKADPITGADEAKFFLVAIQMVSEATRYLYIENKVVASGENSFKPDDKMITLETSWQKTSDVVHKADKDKKCDGQDIKDIKKDIALLKFERKKQSSTNILDGEFWSQIAGVVRDLID